MGARSESLDGCRERNLDQGEKRATSLTYCGRFLAELSHDPDSLLDMGQSVPHQQLALQFIAGANLLQQASCPQAFRSWLWISGTAPHEPKVLRAIRSTTSVEIVLYNSAGTRCSNMHSVTG